MIVVLPCYQGDVEQLKLLLRWIGRLGGAMNHAAIIVADAGTDSADVLDALRLAKESFAEVKITTNSEPVIGWPAGPNSLFLAASKFIKDHWQSHWLWLETDAVPTAPGWSDRLDMAYREGKSRALGVVVPRGGNPASLPERHVTGTAIYPPDIFDVLKDHASPTKAFDLWAPEVMVSITKPTKLIQHFWGKKDLAPTFVEFRGPGSPENALGLSVIGQDTVLFHRNGDGSLIRLLWKKLYPNDPKESDVAVVLPYCNRDYNLLARNLQWMYELHGQIPFRAVLHTDDHTLMQFKIDIERRAARVFASILKNQYTAPEIERWPQAANWAFMKAAEFALSVLKCPWLWLEADAVPVKADWMSTLNSAYRRCGKRFYGPIVPRLGHMNGVGIYPPDAVKRIPRALAQWKNAAWDSVMKHEMIKDCFDASQLIQHVWGVMDGKPHPYSGPAMMFRSIQSLQWVSPTAVIFHRCKDGSLIEWLRKAKMPGNESFNPHSQSPQGQRMAALVPSIN